MAPTNSTQTKAKSKSKSKHKDGEKTKGKKKAVVVTPGDARNEGENPNHAFSPPPGMVALDMSQVDQEFDWDAFHGDENKELWIIRTPYGFKAKQLNGLEIPLPSSAPGSLLSTVDGKRSKFELWSAAKLPSDEQTGSVGAHLGEEITGLSCLLPRKSKKGRLYIARRPISQHIVITQSPAAPHVDELAAPAPPIRESVPEDLLRHRFVPYGEISTKTATTDDTDDRDMDVDVSKPTVSAVEGIEEKRSKKKKDSPAKSSKKRNVEEASPVKSSKKRNLEEDSPVKSSKKRNLEEDSPVKSSKKRNLDGSSPSKSQSSKKSKL